MKLKFKQQAYQTAAVEAVVNCFAGQPKQTGINYRIDTGLIAGQADQSSVFEESGFKNGDIKISDAHILNNIQNLQQQQNLPRSVKLESNKICTVNLDVEMETGTGKTYCYIKTAFELNKRYGWSKFIIVVPSIAIREGVYKSLAITAEHFLESYGKKARFFIYNSKQLHNLESFSSDAGLNIMVINVQAFNATGKDNRRIYEALDDFQSRKPIDVIAANRPILILDEPQKMEGGKTLDSFVAFKPLAMLRYSATHKTTYNKIHRLDALDAYNQKLVKKIAVNGISVKGLTGTTAYLYLIDIEKSHKPPVARLEFEVKQANGIKRVVRKINKNDNLFELSGELTQYKGFTVSDIDWNAGVMSFTNGVQLETEQATGDVNESTLRRIQIREAIKAHLQKERVLFHKGIKVLTLFFIDQVAKYRCYDENGESVGEYAQMFEEEYNEQVNELGTLDDMAYTDYLRGITAAKTHNGYFSIDKKTKRLVDPVTGKRSSETDDVDAYDLILKDKERLLSFEEPTRFIFSHSALREGWDNPNVFVICTLKHSDNTISRRQEVGRGLRLAVNKNGDRMDDPATVHDINVLTVVASESYQDFVAALQKDISDTLSDRPRVADKAYFTGKILKTDNADIVVTADLATDIEFFLIQNGYVDKKRQITPIYHEAKQAQQLAELPVELAPYAEQVFALIDSVFSMDALPFENAKNPKTNDLNDNFKKKEFQELWRKINRKAAYTVHFDSAELIKKCVHTLDDKLHVANLQYTVQRGEQIDDATLENLAQGEAFKVKASETQAFKQSAHSSVKYDLLGQIATGTHTTRQTIAKILQGINANTFYQFRTNPEDFIAKATRLINEQKATMVVEHIAYDPIEESYDMDIFTQSMTLNPNHKGEPLKRHIYNFVATDSAIEQKFASELDVSSEVVVYAKLPKAFYIPTPVGKYNPDWAIAFEADKVKHIYFIAETKGSLSSMELREIERCKTECAKRFFARISEEQVRYDVVDNYDKLMQLVKS
ncbi:MAG: DEAD/DEAH box helicase family protein [Methylococcales bacterium]|nr:DEAD/DEAH box helicase family protein [Methylococcales bacterium]